MVMRITEGEGLRMYRKLLAKSEKQEGAIKHLLEVIEHVDEYNCGWDCLDDDNKYKEIIESIKGE